MGSRDFLGFRVYRLRDVWGFRAKNLWDFGGLGFRGLGL